MPWFAWLILGTLALLAGAMIGTWRQRGVYFLDEVIRFVRKEPSRKAGTEPPATVAPAGVPHVQRYPAEGDGTNSLTGLVTRGRFVESLEAEGRRFWNTGGHFCLAILDLDGFKQLNDRRGRVDCDKVLAHVAALLGSRSRRTNVVARYGGDEFALLMHGANALQAEILAERLRAALEADEILRLFEVTASIGIAAFPDHGRTAPELLKRAEAGVGLARKCGGNCVKVGWLSPQSEDAERNKQLLESCLAAAENGMFLAAPGQDAAPNDSGAVEDNSGAFAEDPRAAGRTSSASAIQMNPLMTTITSLAFAVQARGPHMKDHAEVVSRLASQIARQAGLPEADVETIRLAGLVHDIGKIRVPEYVLRKPTLLTTQEFEIMKSHAAWGAKMLELLNEKRIESIVLHHHERYDGKGYPSGLAGGEIPLGSRMVAVAESFHNMVSDLRYKSTRSFEDALSELRRCAGTQFDPQVVTTFLDWVRTHVAFPSGGGGGNGSDGNS